MFVLFFFFFFNDTATTEIYTLSLHDALPILRRIHRGPGQAAHGRARRARAPLIRRVGGLLHFSFPWRSRRPHPMKPARPKGPGTASKGRPAARLSSPSRAAREGEGAKRLRGCIFNPGNS